MSFLPALALLLFPVMLCLLELGRRVRNRRADAPGSGAIEGAVFGLFGLLLAFTFSGAIARYDAHRQLVTEETNDIGTAYLRLDLLPASSQPALRQMFREYVSSRLHLYDRPGAEVSADAVRLQNEIWQSAVAAGNTAGANPDASKLLLPAINSMVDITSLRQNAFNMHPPRVVFWLLFVFSCVCAFMAGYGMKAGRREWVYSLALAATVTLTVYATLEIEYPREGLLRLTQLDRRIVDLRDSMK